MRFTIGKGEHDTGGDVYLVAGHSEPLTGGAISVAVLDGPVRTLVVVKTVPAFSAAGAPH